MPGCVIRPRRIDHESCSPEDVRVAVDRRGVARPCSWARAKSSSMSWRLPSCPMPARSSAARGATSSTCRSSPAAGRSAACAPSVRTRPAFTVGDWVICDPTVRSRDDALMPDITLQGWSARGAGGQQLQTYFPRRSLGRTHASADRERDPDRRHRRRRGGLVVRLEHAARALWRPSRREAAGR